MNATNLTYITHVYYVLRQYIKLLNVICTIIVLPINRVVFFRKYAQTTYRNVGYAPKYLMRKNKFMFKIYGSKYVYIHTYFQRIRIYRAHV